MKLNLKTSILSTSILLALSYNHSIAQEYNTVYNADSFIAKGNELYGNGKIIESISEYDKVHRSDDKYTDAVYEKLISMVTLDKYAEIIELIAQYKKDGLVDKFPMIHVFEGIALLNTDKQVDALDAFDRAERTIPRNGVLLFNKALAYLKQEKYQKCLDYLIKTIQYNPKHGNAHYLLGTLLIETGKVAEGSMAYMSYLSLAPDGNHANKILQSLNAKLGQYYNADDTLVISKDGDDFSELNMILKNNLSLHQGYKIKSKLDENITRQMQAIIEYAGKHELKNGVIENIYIPWMKEVSRLGLTEEYTYFSLYNHQEQIKKSIKNLDDYYERYNKEFLEEKYWDLFAQRKMLIQGSEIPVVVYYKDDAPYIIVGNKDNQYHGKGISVDRFYNTIGALTFADGELHGDQQYFYPFTNKIKILRTYDNGNKTGLHTEYHINGKIKSQEQYQNDEQHGYEKTYYLSGAKQCELNYKNGILDGAQVCYHEDGTISRSLTYQDGDVHGVSHTYNELGKIISTTHYNKGKKEGKYELYYNNGKIRESATFINDNPKDTLYNYYVGGELESIVIYRDGIRSYDIEYDEYGMITEENYYTNGSISSAKYYDFDGKHFMTEYYQDKELTKLELMKNGVPQVVNMSNDYDIIDTRGVKLLSVKVQPDGKTNTFYHNNGMVSSTIPFRNKKRNGIYTGYYNNGTISYRGHYVDGVTHGLYENFNRKGQKVGTRYYNEDDQVGPNISYFDNGTISSESFYQEGDRHGDAFSYWLNKKVKDKNTYINGEIYKRVLYDNMGNPCDSIDFYHTNGKFSYNAHLERYEGSLLNGLYDGAFTITDMTDTTLLVHNHFKGGLEHGNATVYYPHGPKKYEFTSILGDKYGEETFYDIAGNKLASYTLVKDDLHGDYIRYYNNGKISYIKKFVYGVEHGPTTYYNMDGTPIIIIDYKKGIPVSYAALDNQGSIGEKKIIDKTTTKISSKYPDGKTAFSMELKLLMKDGLLSIYNADGTLLSQSSFTDDLLNGKRINNYANGKPYITEHFVHNNNEDEQIAYDPAGNVIIKINYRLDECHGPLEIYNNGKLIKTKIFDTNDVVEIKR